MSNKKFKLLGLPSIVSIMLIMDIIDGDFTDISVLDAVKLILYGIIILISLKDWLKLKNREAHK